MQVEKRQEIDKATWMFPDRKTTNQFDHVVIK